MISHILILMTADTLMAIDIDADGRDEYVSLEGSTSMIYRSRSDIQKFDQYIRDYYNVNRYEEGEFSLLVLQCGANTVDVQYLCSMFTGATGFGTVDIRYVLPLVAVSLGLMEKGCEVHMSVLGVQYTVFTDERGQIHCLVLGSTCVEAQVLSPKRLGVLFRLNVDAFVQNNDVLRELQELVQQLEAEIRSKEKQQSEKEAVVKEMNQFIEDAIKRESALKDTIAEKQKKIDALETEVSRLERKNFFGPVY